ncbi:hypothetical protein GCM10009798_23780 [Nocardioides panacihumi]|uniref:Rhodanese domain-containing protein n=1 Tax=Nocardioides panacihumi TaxID=400774 RepID=A0ABN2R3P9_9ACTN
MTHSPTDAPSPAVEAPREAPDRRPGGRRLQLRLTQSGGRDGGRRLALRVLAVLGVVVPVVLTAWYASGLTVVFDGAMNLQVAQNVADGDGYRWDYAARELFPAAIQTSGPYIFLAAAFIKVLGTSELSLQAANLVFVLILAVSVSVGLRHWALLRTVGPSIVLFGVPGALASGLGGYGEMAIAALAISSFVLLDMAATTGRRPALLTAAAAFVIGLALTIKVVAAMALPVLLLGALLVAVMRRGDTRWWRVVLSLFAIIPPLVLFELYRLASLKGDYVNWWHEQFTAISYQAGVDKTTAPAKHGLAKMAEHLHILSSNVGMPAEALGPLLVLPFLALAIVIVARPTAFLTRLRDRGVVLLVLASVYAGGYLAWWLAVTPTEKAWLRRVAIGLVAFAVACLVLAGVVIDRLRARNGEGRLSRGVVWFAALATTAALVLGVFAVKPTARGIIDSARADQNSATLTAARAAGKHAHELAASGATLYGIGWWSAPAVSLYGNVSLQDLSTVKDPCVVTKQDAYVVWDWYAMNIANPVPRMRGYSFEPVPKESTPYAAVFRIKPGPQVRCGR